MRKEINKDEYRFIFQTWVDDKTREDCENCVFVIKKEGSPSYQLQGLASKEVLNDEPALTSYFNAKFETMKDMYEKALRNRTNPH